MAAFEKKTGKVLWEVEDKWGASYASPVVATIQGKVCALVIAAGESRPTHGGLLTIDVESGEVYDRFSWRAKVYESVLASSPLVVDDQLVFISDCYEKGGVLLEFDEDLSSQPLWMQREFGMHFMMPMVKGRASVWIRRAQSAGYGIQVCEFEKWRIDLDEGLSVEERGRAD